MYIIIQKMIIMNFISSFEKGYLKNLSSLTFCNPFLPKRLDFEKKLLGSRYQEEDLSWHIGMNPDGVRPNIKFIKEDVRSLLLQLKERILKKAKVKKGDQDLYQDAVVFHLYHEVHEELESIINGSHSNVRQCFKDYSKKYDYFFDRDFILRGDEHEKAHLFSCFYQAKRAFYYIFNCIAGSSRKSWELRASIWQSLFTHDLKRYRRSLYTIIKNGSTLISGPSGTGKELVAAAIGRSAYLPFSTKTHSFSGQENELFYALNLSALPIHLIESELFGHVKGAYTGAFQERKGWLETCSDVGCVFIDEVGELEQAVQVKLLRVLQERKFHRIGEVKERTFLGKIISATNRNLLEEVAEGRFRQDLYYRLCSDIIETPSLYDILNDQPNDLNQILSFVVQKMVPDEEIDSIVQDTEVWIQNKLPKSYPWPGNIRELEQCVRNIMIRKSYQPKNIQHKKAEDPFICDILDGRLSLEDLNHQYVKRIYQKVGSYEKAAEVLGVDRRTVKQKLL